MKKTKMLKKNYEFKRVLTKGKCLRGKCIEIYLFSNRTKGNYLGIAIGKKIAKSVQRNRIKRLIRENYRLLEDRMKPGYSIVFLWNKKVEIRQATFYAVQEDMINLFQKEGILEE